MPSFLRRQEPARLPPTPPSPIHPSPLLGGRLGGGWEAPSVHQRPSGRPPSLPPSLLFRHSCHSLSVIPALAGTVGAARVPAYAGMTRGDAGMTGRAQAGTHHPSAHNQHAPSQLPQENSSLPPFRGEVRWGVGGTEPAPAALLRPDRLAPIPAYAGMTRGGRRDDGWAMRAAAVGAMRGVGVGAMRAAAGGANDRWHPLGAPHPPPNLPPKRGEG